VRGGRNAARRAAAARERARRRWPVRGAQAVL